MTFQTSSSVSTGLAPSPSAVPPCAGVVQPSQEQPILSVISSFHDLEPFAAEWDEAVIRLGAPIYMTFDWLKTWWEFYGKEKQLRCFVFRQGQNFVALIPIYLETFGFGPLELKLARLVGANIPPKTFNPPLDAAFGVKALSEAIRYLLQTEKCDMISFGPVSTSWPGHGCFRGALAAAGELVGRSSYQERDVQTWFQLPATFEEYLQSLSGSERKSRMKRVRHLEKEHQVASDIVSDPALLGSEFDAFVKQHASQWQAIGKSGHFAAWPHGEEYNRSLVRAQGLRGRVRFFRMLVDGRVVSNRYTFLLGRTLFSELPARACGEPWDKLGIGGVSLLKFNESAIQAGIRDVDSGLGAYDHKAQLGGDQIPVGIWRVSGRGVHGIKARGFRLLSGILLLACHKLWYRRILPHLPGSFPRKQSLWWLRFDA